MHILYIVNCSYVDRNNLTRKLTLTNIWKFTLSGIVAAIKKL